MAALISNKPEFVKLFLENGVRLTEFVTWDTLLSLYRHLDPSCLFHSKLQKVLAEEPERPAGGPTVPHVQMHHVAQVLRELLGDFTQPLYPRPRTGDRPRLLLPVPNMKLNVRAGDPLPPPPPPSAGPGCWAAARSSVLLFEEMISYFHWKGNVLLILVCQSRHPKIP